MEYMDAKKIVVNTGHLNYDYLACEYVMNIYWGCSHGCLYCYARSDYYDKMGNLGGDFDRVRAKKDALRIIRDDLRRKVKTGVVLSGGMSDAYNPEEKELQLTRHALELINAFDFGACIITKSSLVTRDTDVLREIRQHSPASVNFSITCSDDGESRRLEPGVSPTTERFEAIAHLRKNGIPAGVLMDPVVPYVTDTEENVREMVKKAGFYGASYMYLSTQVTMSDGQREYFYREADKQWPGTSDIYKQKYGSYYYCRSPRAKRLRNAFMEACEKEKMVYDMRMANQIVRSGYAFPTLSFDELTL